MEAVQAQVISHYRSELVTRIRVNGGVLTAPGRLTVKLAKEFGFCYGVERAIDLAYAARRVFPPPRPIYLLGEIIHNPEVNDQIRNMGIVTIPAKPGPAEMNQLKADDVVIIPAFGTEVQTRKELEAKGCMLVDTTCGDVMSVWKRVRQYARESVTSIIHGKAEARGDQGHDFAGHDLWHRTLSGGLQPRRNRLRLRLHRQGGDKAEFLERFKGAYSPGFDPDLHLDAVGVANQTTMLRGETEEVQRRIRRAMETKFGPATLDAHFRFFDTICGATQDRQDALEKLLAAPLICWWWSGDTTRPTRRIWPRWARRSCRPISSRTPPRWCLTARSSFQSHPAGGGGDERLAAAGQYYVGITAGASCPNNLIEDAIRRLFELKGVSVEELLCA
jgi:4-hydroxy-3-methylbut-2-en-1-yl diphosphate reductase